MHRHRPLLAALALAAACDCGGGGTQPIVRVGDACTRQSDCGSALLCWSGACAESLPAAPTCSTPGAAPSLLAGTAVVAADPGAGVCTFPVREVVLPAGQVQDLGENGVGQVVSFTVPAGTWSVTIIEQEVDDSAPASVTFQGTPVPNAAVPDDVIMQDGRKLFDDTPASIPTDADGYDDYTGFLSVHFGAATPGTGSATFPNTTPGLELARVAGELPPGTWTLKVNDYAYECTFLGTACVGGSTAGRYRVHVLTRGPPTSTGRLDLDVYLATSDGAGNARITAAQAAASPALERLFQTLASYLGQAGLCLGTVTFHDLPDWARQRFASTEYAGTACDELSQLFRLALAPTPNVQLFLVDELTDASPGQIPGTTLAGVDGAIPGPSGVPGGPSSGTVAALGEVAPCSGPISLSCEADFLGYVGAHEIGHWLGLFHTTEFTGTQFDPLGDTAKCPCSRCASATGRPHCADPVQPTPMFSDRCGSSTCGGASNLMFWIVSGSSVGQLTAEQSEVVRLNPAVR